MQHNNFKLLPNCSVNTPSKYKPPLLHSFCDVNNIRVMHQLCIDNFWTIAKGKCTCRQTYISRYQTNHPGKLLLLDHRWREKHGLRAFWTTDVLFMITKEIIMQNFCFWTTGGEKNMDLELFSSSYFGIIISFIKKNN